MGKFKIEPCRVHVPGCMDLVYYDDKGRPIHEIIVDDEALVNLRDILIKNYPVSLNDFDIMDIADHMEECGISVRSLDF